MFATRLSWFYNFKGPSKIVDTGPLLRHCSTRSLLNDSHYQIQVFLEDKGVLRS